MDYNALIDLLSKECDFRLDDATMLQFLQGGTIRRLRSGEILINTGEFNSDVFIVVSGIIRFSDMNGESERTYAFGLPGTLFMSKHSFVYGLPSYYQIDACCESTLLCIPAKHYWRMVDESHEFAKWSLHIAQEELFYQERKNMVINGNAKERFDAMIKNRPEIMRHVQQKIIASYLGITPQYLCRLKRMENFK